MRGIFLLRTARLAAAFLRALSSGLASMIAIAAVGALWLISVPCRAQTNSITVLASFTGANGGNPLTNGETPMAGLTSDGQGNFWGTTYYGGANGQGCVFEY